MGINEKRLVESVLFSASKPVSINEIKEATNLSPNKIKKTIDELIQDYNVKEDNRIRRKCQGFRCFIVSSRDYISGNCFLYFPGNNPTENISFEYILKTCPHKNESITVATKQAYDALG